MKQKRKLWNLLMVVAIIAIAVIGVFSVGKLKGWFGKNEITVTKEDGTEETVTLVAKSKIGTVNVERKNLAFSLENDANLQDGDILETREGASIDIVYGENTLSFNENSEAEISISEDGAVSVLLKTGEIFANVEDPFTLNVYENEVGTEKGVFFACAPVGSAEIGVLDQQVQVGDKEVVQSGQRASLLADGIQISELTLDSMNQFQLSKAKTTNETKLLCFSNSDIEQLERQREEEQKATAEEALAAEMAQAEQGSAQNQAGQKTDASAGNTSASQAGGNTSQTGSSQTENISDAGSGNAVTNSGAAESNGVSSGNADGSSTETTSMKCTISIRCDEILNHMDALEEGKDVYVPASGCILSSTQVTFEQGETVFDVLKRACNKNGIALEYSWSPMYNSYYIEGINNLYEFDCGSASGWKYKVNGWFPNYGCSSYTLKDGDTIVWSYTVTG